MRKIIDFMMRLGENRYNYEIERLKRVYPYFFEDSANENKIATPVREDKKVNGLKSLEARHSHMD